MFWFQKPVKEVEYTCTCVKREWVMANTSYKASFSAKAVLKITDPKQKGKKRKKKEKGKEEPTNINWI